MEFARVSSFWELINKEPLSSVMYTSEQIDLRLGQVIADQIQNPSVAIFTRDIGKNKHMLMLWNGPIREGIRTNGFFS
jgi:hypothetical protein